MTDEEIKRAFRDYIWNSEQPNSIINAEERAFSAGVKLAIRNQPADTPITEEALRESYKIFNEYRGSIYSFLEIEIRYGVYIRMNFKQGMLYNVGVWLDDEYHSTLIFPNCRTMQDLETLIRLLGGAK